MTFNNSKLEEDRLPSVEDYNTLIARKISYRSFYSLEEKRDLITLIEKMGFKSCGDVYFKDEFPKKKFMNIMNERSPISLLERAKLKYSFEDNLDERIFWQLMDGRDLIIIKDNFNDKNKSINSSVGFYMRKR